MFLTATDCDYFTTLVNRMRDAGCTPIALYGAGRVARSLRPAEAGGDVVAIIDDDPARQGGEWAGLPVVSREEALAMGVRTVIVAAERPVQDKLWANRSVFLKAGARVLCVPQRFDEKPWDGCLADHYDHTIAVRQGLEPSYAHDYPKADETESSWLLEPLLQCVEPGDAVCEIGTGNGRWSQHVIAQASAYYAVDYSERLLFEVIEHRFADHLEKLHLIHDETATLAGVPDASADVLFSFDVFVHFKSDLVHQFIASVARVLTPGGKALIHFATWNDNAIKIWETQHTASHGGGSSLIFYNHPEWLATSAKAHGLAAREARAQIGQNVLMEFTKPA